MKKKAKKLLLTKETVRKLNQDELASANGGTSLIGIPISLINSGSLPNSSLESVLSGITLPTSSF